jgi:hypothetical protein
MRSFKRATALSCAPHPRTVQISGKRLDALSAHFRGNPRFLLDKDIAIIQIFLDSHIMIRGWSEVAMKF